MPSAHHDSACPSRKSRSGARERLVAVPLVRPRGRQTKATAGSRPWLRRGCRPQAGRFRCRAQTARFAHAPTTQQLGSALLDAGSRARFPNSSAPEARCGLTRVAAPRSERQPGALAGHGGSVRWQADRRLPEPRLSRTAARRSRRRAGRRCGRLREWRVRGRGRGTGSGPALLLRRASARFRFAAIRTAGPEPARVARSRQ
jgi:hypothetical protein